MNQTEIFNRMSISTTYMALRAGCHMKELHKYIINFNEYYKIFSLI